jgi:hypothetical protein
MKLCPGCGVEKPRHLFAKRFQAKSGISRKCLDCLAEYRRNWSAERPRYHQDVKKRHRLEAYAFVRAYLATHPCVDCGESDIVVLEFDHVRGVKERNISDMCRRAFRVDRLAEEMTKCDVRCANCHRRKTFHNRETAFVLTVPDTLDTLPPAQTCPRQLTFESLMKDS